MVSCCTGLENWQLDTHNFTDTGDFARHVVRKAKSRIHRKVKKRKNQSAPLANEDRSLSWQSTQQSSTTSPPVENRHQHHSTISSSPLRNLHHSTTSSSPLRSLQQSSSSPLRNHHSSTSSSPMGKLQLFSTSLSPMEKLQQTQSLLHKKTFHLPPIRSSPYYMTSPSATLSPDTGSQLTNSLHNKNTATATYSPACKRALFIGTQKPHTVVCLSNTQSDATGLLQPVPPKNGRNSRHLQSTRRIVYLSDPQSPFCIDGSPCAPPTTPLPDMNSSVCYVPPLHDIKVRLCI